MTPNRIVSCLWSIPVDRTMAKQRLSELCTLLTPYGFSARVEGEDCAVHAVNTLEDAGPGEITFLSNAKYLSAVDTTKASAVIIKDGIPVPEALSAIRCSDPYAAVAVAIIALHGFRKHPQWGQTEQANIHPSAKIGAHANIARGVTVEADAVVGDTCTMYPGCYVGCGVRIGHECTLHPNVVVYDGCELGNRVTIHAGSVVGEDGLGYAPFQEKWIKIPQAGRVVIGDDVEIGANCAIDRAALGQTEIQSGTKFGNVIVIGHGTKIGPDCLFVGQVGIAGSVTVGRHVTLAGQVGVAGHLTIGDDVTVAAQSGIPGDVEKGKKVFGSPAYDLEDAKRAIFATRKLPEWIKRVKVLERELADLRKMVDAGVPD